MEVKQKLSEWADYSIIVYFKISCSFLSGFWYWPVSERISDQKAHCSDLVWHSHMGYIPDPVDVNGSFVIEFNEARISLMKVTHWAKLINKLTIVGPN